MGVRDYCFIDIYRIHYIPQDKTVCLLFIVQKWLIPVFAERAITRDFEISLFIFNGTAALLYKRARYLLYYPVSMKKIN